MQKRKHSIIPPKTGYEREKRADPKFVSMSPTPKLISPLFQRNSDLPLNLTPQSSAASKARPLVSRRFTQPVGADLFKKDPISGNTTPGILSTASTPLNSYRRPVTQPLQQRFVQEQKSSNQVQQTYDNSKWIEKMASDALRRMSTRYPQPSLLSTAPTTSQ